MVSATQVVRTAATAASAAVPPARNVCTPTSAVTGWLAATPAATPLCRSIRRSVGPAVSWRGGRYARSARRTHPVRTELGSPVLALGLQLRARVLRDRVHRVQHGPTRFH